MSERVTEEEEAARDGSGNLLSPRALAGLWALVALVLLAGLFLPDLMYGDAAQDAVMAMRMFREGDFVHLLKNGRDYLDKPHLLFWSAMAAYRLLGVHDYAYRLPSVLVSLLGAFSAGKIARRLYGQRAGQLAPLLFIASLAIVIGDHDVRMDALLTGFTAFAIWQLLRFADTDKLSALLFGAVGLGLAVSSKGMVAVAFAGLCLVLYLFGKGKMRLVFSPKVVLGLAVFLLTLAPVLLSYYLQFDLHPEKVVDGRTGVSGVKFILFGQSADRFGGGQGESAAQDYFFFLHTLLWAFLPWSGLLVAAFWERIRGLVKGGLSSFRAEEELTFLGPLLYVVVLNLSKFKLPHYLNLAFPLLSVLVVGHADKVARGGHPRALSFLTRLQDVLVVLLLLFAVFLNGWAFRLHSVAIGVSSLVYLAALVPVFRAKDPLHRLLLPSLIASLFGNYLQNANFYPGLCRYQPGSAFAGEVLQRDVDFGRFFFLGDEIYQPFQLYTGHLIPSLEVRDVVREVEGALPAYLLVDEDGKAALEKAGLELTKLTSSPACRVTMIRWPLLDPGTRETFCPRAYLVWVKARG